MLKQAAMEHDLEVRRWRQKLAGDTPSIPVTGMSVMSKAVPKAPAPKKPGVSAVMSNELLRERLRKALRGNSAGAKKVLDKSGSQKEARGGHPVNIAFARMLRPGLFPGLDPDGPRVKVMYNGETEHPMAKFFGEAVDYNTRNYLRSKTAFETPDPEKSKLGPVKSTQYEDIQPEKKVDLAPSEEERIPSMPWVPTVETPTETVPKEKDNEKEASAISWWFEQL